MSMVCSLSIESFESGLIDPATFDHDAHIFVAWMYLQKYPLGESGDRFNRALKKFTATIGHSGKYHATISWFFLVAIAGRLPASRSETWNDFKQRNADIFHSREFLHRYYSSKELESDVARQVFVLPTLGIGARG